MNLYLFNLIHQFAGLYWPLDWMGIFFAKYLGYAILVSVAVFGFKNKSTKQKLSFFTFLLLALVISGVILATFRYVYASPRPFLALNFEPLIAHENSGSFPSGHVIFYFTLAFAVYLFNKKVGYWLFGAAFFVALGRIFVGVHWPLDIAGGVASAFFSAYLSLKLLNQPKAKEIPLGEGVGRGNAV
ncbi:MAG: phosphatase PAP2 family protein [Candidatus Liptonbacteria bacterium]|nr:phosphatase PAP2 family protein [Candidatus Liptonbacteria bacterium]